MDILSLTKEHYAVLWMRRHRFTCSRHECADCMIIRSLQKHVKVCTNGNICLRNQFCSAYNDLCLCCKGDIIEKNDIKTGS